MYTLTEQGYEEVVPLVYKIGDIKISARNDFDNSWALCNGDFFNAQEYPELFNVIGNNLEEGNFDKIYMNAPNTSTSTKIIKILYENNIYIGITSWHYIVFSYDGINWSYLNLQSVCKNMYFKNILFVNNQWVISGYYTSSENDIVCFLNSVNPTEIDNWTFIDTNLILYKSSYFNVNFLNNYFIINALYNDTSLVIYYSNSLNSAWNSNIINVGDTINSYFSNMIYYNQNYFFAVPCSSPSPTTYKTRIYYSNSLNSNWNNYVFQSETNDSFFFGDNSFFLFNDYLCLIYGSSASKLNFSYFEDNFQNFQTSVLYSTRAGSVGNNYCAVSVNNILYIIHSLNIPSVTFNNFLYYSNNLQDWNSKNFFFENTEFTYLTNFEETNWIISTIYRGEDTNNYLLATGALLPNINMDKSYAYIKIQGVD